MGAFLYYLFQSTLCLTVLCVLFRCFFRADTLFRTNRLMLLGGVVVCLLLPLFPLQVAQEVVWNEPLESVREWLITEATDGELPGAPQGQSVMGSGEQAAMASPDEAASMPRRLFSVYLIGTCATLLLLLLSMLRMWRLMHRYPARRDREGNRIVRCPEPVRTFSWGNTIVLAEADADEKADIVLLHERMHLRYRHTLDLLLMEAVLALHWFNPAVWLLMKYLREVHEFEADNGVINQGIDATQYQLLLVRKCVGTRLYSMTCTFRSGRLKKRITMMLKKRTSKRAHLKLLLLVPAAALAMAAFAQQQVKGNESVAATNAPAKYVTNKADTASKERIIPVSIAFYSEGKEVQVLENMTLAELEKELGVAVYSATDEPITVSLKMNASVKKEEMARFKEVLRNAYLAKKKKQQ